MIDYFHINMDRDHLLSLSTLGLAHLGDGVYELMVRSFRRGRNTAPHSVPKAASRAQYQTATGLEALFGWLYLQGRTERLNELFERLMDEPGR